MAAVVDFDFEVPASCEAHEPPEERGLARDGVRLMVARRSNGKLEHARFHELPRFLRAGDLVVINTSSQIPAAVAASASRRHGARAAALDADARGPLACRATARRRALHRRGGR